MFGKQIKLFSMFGFAVRMDLSWIVLAVLISWSLATLVFPHMAPDLSQTAYWVMGAAGAVGLFLSIVVHELCHSLVAARYGLPMKGITLFIFGGVAEMSEEPPSAKAEFLMAIAGPLASIGVAAAAYAAFVLGLHLAWPEGLVAVLGWLGLINVILVAFNLIPGFPLDGGRVLRAGLWQWKKNVRWATRVASRIGAGFGILLIAMGAVEFLLGSFISGLWWLLIGLFIRNAAARSYEQLLVRQVLEHEPVSRIMNTAPVTVPPTLSVQSLVDDYMLRFHFTLFPVVQDGRLIGCVDLPHVKQVPQSAWANRNVVDIMDGCSRENAVSPETEAIEAMKQLAKTDMPSRMMVIQDGRLVGILSTKDLMRFIAMKMELGGDTGPARVLQTQIMHEAPEDEVDQLAGPRPPRPLEPPGPDYGQSKAA